MAGIAIVLDLLRKNPSISGQTLHSYGVFSAKVAASAAAASIAATTPFASRAFFGNSEARIAFCDAGTGLREDYISSLRSDSTINFDQYSLKLYIVEQKPLLSAFYWRNFAITSLRSFLLNYLPILESHMKRGEEEEEEDDEDFFQDTQEEKRVDLITPFKASIKHIFRETTVVTTRRVLERLAACYVSQRMAWKLLKDIPKSAARKAGRGMPTLVYIYSVSKTTLRGYCLGVLASWAVQVGIDIWGLFKLTCDREEKARLLGKKVYNVSVKCGSSLVFASIGAGIGAAFIRPTIGQWIGCALGDLAGPFIVSLCLGKAAHLEV